MEKEFHTLGSALIAQTLRLGAIFSISIFISYFCQQAFAQSADEMVANCRPIVEADIRNDSVILPDRLDVGICWGAFRSFQNLSAPKISDFHHNVLDICAPSEIRLTQWIRIFVNHVGRNPQLGHEDYHFVALVAFWEQFPCE